tara:strand:- start:304 stop:645 length:342 start_codon:yes stop_codon:yes gene_type:complete
MIDASQCQEYLASVQAFAESVQTDEGQDLDSRLAYLAGYACHNTPEDTRCRLFPDFAPQSFAFTMERKNKAGQYEYWFNGGLIFHGNHDGGGDGSAPTFSVNLNPVSGWSVHT